jgi:uncharacterized protein YkwD
MLLRYALPLVVSLFALLAAVNSTPVAQAAPTAQLTGTSSNCNNNSGSVTFTWAPAGVGTQWLDLSLLNNGFADGTYLTAGPLGPDDNSLTWPEIMTGRVHYWRVTTLAGDGWSISATGTFTVCGSPRQAAAPPAAPVEVSLSGHAVRMIEAHNGQRSSTGLPSFAVDPALVRVAQERANDMAARGYFDHVSPNGETAFTLMDRYGIYYLAAGENIARNNYSAAETVAVAMEGFMNSPSHRANILEPGYSRIGVGVAYAGDMKYFAVVFAGP